MTSVTATLLVAIVANITTVVVLVMSNRSARRRDEAREAREDARLERQRSDQREQWDREAMRRRADLRIDPHVDFYQELRRASLAIHNARYRIGPTLGFGWQLPAYEALQRLRVFASEPVWDAASAAYSALWKWGAESERYGEAVQDLGFESEAEGVYDDLLDDYLRAVRNELDFEPAT